MRLATTRFPAPDGTPLACHSALPGDPEPGGAGVAATVGTAVLILHGIAWHGRPYRDVFGTHLVPHGIAVHALDLRGHGASGGTRGVLAPRAVNLADIGAVSTHVRAMHPGARLVLAAESMGAIYALSHLAESPHAAAALVLVAPGVCLSPAQILDPHGILDLARAVRRPSAPTIDIVGPRMARAVRGKAFLDLRRGDPLAFARLSLRYLLRLAAASAAMLARDARRVDTPTLIVQGTADRAVSPRGASLLARVMPARPRVLWLPGVAHDVLWDPAAPAMFAAMRAWLA